MRLPEDNSHADVAAFCRARMSFALRSHSASPRSSMHYSFQQSMSTKCFWVISAVSYAVALGARPMSTRGRMCFVLRRLATNTLCGPLRRPITKFPPLCACGCCIATAASPSSPRPAVPTAATGLAAAVVVPPPPGAGESPGRHRSIYSCVARSPSAGAPPAAAAAISVAIDRAISSGMRVVPLAEECIE